MVVLVVVPGRAVALGELGVIMAAGAMGWDFFPRLPGVLMSGVGGHGGQVPSGSASRTPTLPDITYICEPANISL
jgi:hypothetical protein